MIMETKSQDLQSEGLSTSRAADGMSSSLSVKAEEDQCP